MLLITFRVILLVRHRPRVKYMRELYPYITSSDSYVNPACPIYEPITIIELITNGHLLCGGYYNLYMFFCSSCNTRTTQLSSQKLYFGRDRHYRGFWSYHSSFLYSHTASCLIRDYPVSYFWFLVWWW